MNKLIFQIGLLGFCVGLVFFGSAGLPLIRVITQAFMVFIGLMIGGMLVYAVALSMASHPKRTATSPSAPSLSADEKPDALGQKPEDKKA